MNEIEKIPEVENFLNGLIAKSTKLSYKSNLKIYFNVIQADPNHYFDGKRDYEGDVREFWNSLIHKPACSRNGRMNTIKMFLEDNDIEFAGSFWRKLRRHVKGNRPVTLDRSPTRQELKQILLHGNVQARALFLMSSSSGMRISEILQLKSTDIERDKEPVLIKVRAEYTKTNEPRICFISNEAKEALEVWLKERNEYLSKAVEKTNHLHPKPLNDPTIFPIGTCKAGMLWRDMIIKAELNERDPTTNRYVLHINSLRKYFMSRMEMEVSKNIVEGLAGHAGYLSQAYRRYNQEQLAEFYKKGVHTILVFDVPFDSSDLEERLAEKDEEIFYMKKEMKVLMERQERLEMLDNRFTKILGDKDVQKLMIQKLKKIV